MGESSAEEGNTPRGDLLFMPPADERTSPGWGSRQNARRAWSRTDRDAW